MFAHWESEIGLSIGKKATKELFPLKNDYLSLHSRENELVLSCYILLLPTLIVTGEICFATTATSCRQEQRRCPCLSDPLTRTLGRRVGGAPIRHVASWFRGFSSQFMRSPEVLQRIECTGLLILNIIRPAENLAHYLTNCKMWLFEGVVIFHLWGSARRRAILLGPHF